MQRGFLFIYMALKSTKANAVSRRRFMLWLATPEPARQPISQRALAEELGIHEVTLSNWKTPAFMAQVNELVDKYFHDAYPQGVDALKRMVARGSFPHLKMYFEMLGKYTPPPQRNLNFTKDVSALSDDELDDLIAGKG